MRFINPYNFVPLAKREPAEAKALEDHSDKDKQSEAAKTQKDYTGFITYDLYTKTPLFIPNTSNPDTFKVPGKVKDHKSFEFFSYQDLTGESLEMDSSGPADPVIPGSEVRGMFRSNYEILTNSCLSVVDEDKDVVMAKRTMEAFKAGLIRKDGKGNYSLFKAEDCLLRTEGANSLKDKIDFDESCDWKRKSYVLDDVPGVGRLAEGEKVNFKEIVRGRYDKSLATAVKRFNSSAAGDVGYLIKGEPGPEMGNKQEKHCGHVFKLKDKKNQVNGSFSINVLEKALDEYERSSKRYSEYVEAWRSFKENVANVGEYFPVYYSKAASSDYIYLSPACMTREIYEKKMSGLLGKYAPCRKKEALCPACSLFGTVGKDEKGKMFNVSSRVRFTDLHLKKETVAKYRRIVTLKELSSPKLSNTEFYLKRPSKDAWFWTYDYYVDDKGTVHSWTTEINGRKFYWHKKEADLPHGVEVTERNSTVRPLEEGALFSGRVYFEHISKAELDLLIFLVNTGDALNLEDNDAVRNKPHGFKLGAGKPLGLGSIATSVREIEIRKISIEGASVDLRNEPYTGYNADKVPIEKDIRENFELLTSFDAVPNSKDIKYPTTGRPGTDGKIHIFDWYTQNHVGYRIKDGEYIKNDMPNSRTQMAFDQYMIPLKTELEKTSYKEVVKVKPKSGSKKKNGKGGQGGKGGNKSGSRRKG